MSEPMADTDARSGGRERKGLALIVLSIALALDVSGLGIVNPALPELGRRFDMSSTSLQWIVSSYAVAFAALLLFGGRAADVLGRRRIFSVGIGVFAVSSFGAAVAPDAIALIFARAGQGVGAALAGPASLALITYIFPEGEQRNRAFGVYASVGAVSFTAGLLLGGALTDVFGWRSVFVFTGVLAALTLLPIPRVLPVGGRAARSLDPVGVLTVAIALVLGVIGVNELSTSGRLWIGVVATAAAVVVAVGFVVWERAADDPLLPLALFASKPVQNALLTAVVFFTAMTSVLFFAPIYMQSILGYSPLLSGLAGIPIGIVVVASSGIGSRLLARIGPLRMMIVGLLLVAAGVGWWVRTPIHGHYWLDILPGILIMGLGQGMTYVSMTASSLTDVPDEQHGVAGGLNVTAQQLGSSVGVAVVVTIAAAATSSQTPAGYLAGYHAAYVAGSVVALAGAALLALRLRTARPAPKHV